MSELNFWPMFSCHTQTHAPANLLGWDNLEKKLAYQAPPKTPQIWGFDSPTAYFSPVVEALRKHQEPSRHDTRIDVIEHFFAVTSCDVTICLACLSNQTCYWGKITVELRLTPHPPLASEFGRLTFVLSCPRLRHKYERNDCHAVLN